MSCIRHRPGQWELQIAPYYYEVAKVVAQAAIVNVFHQSWLRREKLRITLKDLVPLIFGLAAEKAARGHLKQMIQGGWIEESAPGPDEIQQYLCQKKPQRLKRSKSFGLKASTCLWCQGETLSIEDHHYPIPKSQGGTETVSICPNCHAEFHRLLDTHIY